MGKLKFLLQTQNKLYIMFTLICFCGHVVALDGALVGTSGNAHGKTTYFFLNNDTTEDLQITGTHRHQMTLYRAENKTFKAGFQSKLRDGISEVEQIMGTNYSNNDFAFAMNSHDKFKNKENRGDIFFKTQCNAKPVYFKIGAMNDIHQGNIGQAIINFARGVMVEGFSAGTGIGGFAAGYYRFYVKHNLTGPLLKKAMGKVLYKTFLVVVALYVLIYLISDKSETGIFSNRVMYHYIQPYNSSKITTTLIPDSAFGAHSVILDDCLSVSISQLDVPWLSGKHANYVPDEKDAAMVLTLNNPMIPEGDYIHSCEQIEYDQHNSQISAVCKNSGGYKQNSTLTLNTNDCDNLSTISNVNGKLTCNSNPLPDGSYKRSCIISMYNKHQNKFKAICKKNDASWNLQTSLPMCLLQNQTLANVNGNLECKHEYQITPKFTLKNTKQSVGPTEIRDIQSGRSSLENEVVNYLYNEQPIHLFNFAYLIYDKSNDQSDSVILTLQLGDHYCTSDYTTKITDKTKLHTCVKRINDKRFEIITTYR